MQDRGSPGMARNFRKVAQARAFYSSYFRRKV